MPEAGVTRYLVDPGLSGLRLDQGLAQLTGLSRRRAKTLVAEGWVWVNGRACRVESRVLQVGDVVDVLPVPDPLRPPQPLPPPLPTPTPLVLPTEASLTESVPMTLPLEAPEANPIGANMLLISAGIAAAVVVAGAVIGLMLMRRR